MNRSFAPQLLRSWATAVLLLSASLASGQTSPLPWVNATRTAVGAPILRPDELLSHTAGFWAGLLAQAGVLSHRGADGSSVLDRYRSLGGSEARVGEILGAGPSLAAIEAGWLGSEEHQRLALDPVWTHVGWGSALSPGASGGEIWVVVFCQKLVEGLTLESRDGLLLLSGRFLSPAAVQARLIDGLDPVPAAEWDAAARRFSFEIPDPDGYFRLGYVAAGGAFILTNAFTWPPGTGSPAGPARSSKPAAPP